MAACVNHPTVPATAFCRTCGKALCEHCKKDVRGVVYCEDCLVAHLQNVMPPPATSIPAAGAPYIDSATGFVRPPSVPNPTLAAFLGFIPGVGAFYNGQYQKGIVHVLMFPALIVLTEQADYIGVLIPFYFFYMAWDAYMTARSRVTGEPVPDPLGINNLFGMEPRTATTTQAAPGVAGTVEANAAPGDAAGAASTAAPKSGLAGAPIGAFILIGLGVMFLLGDISHHLVNNFWPVILIVIGIWKGIAVWEVKQ